MYPLAPKLFLNSDDILWKEYNDDRRSVHELIGKYLNFKAGCEGFFYRL